MVNEITTKVSKSHKERIMVGHTTIVNHLHF